MVEKCKAGKEGWLTKFKQQLNGQPSYTDNWQDVLLYENNFTYLTKILGYDSTFTIENVNGYNPKYNRTNETYRYALIQKEHAKYPETSVEQLFSQYRNFPLILSNKLLRKINKIIKVHYHIAILDATDDYLLNKVPKLFTLKEKENNELELIKNDNVQDKLIFYNIAQCIVFINDNSEYFLALPAVLMPKFMRNTNIAPYVIKTNLKTIAKVLQPINLLKVDGYLFRWTNINHNYKTNDEEDLNNYMCSTVENLRNTVQMIAPFSEYFRSLANYNKQNRQSTLLYYKQELYNQVRPYIDLSVLNRTNITINQDGTFNCQWQKANKFWQIILQHLKYFSVDDLMANINYEMHFPVKAKKNRDLLKQNPTRGYFFYGRQEPDTNWLTDKTLFLAYFMLKAIRKISLKPKQTTAEVLTFPQKENLKPLMATNGLNELLRSLADNQFQVHFCLNDRLFKIKQLGPDFEIIETRKI